MKILLLIIYNNNTVYDELLYIQKTYIHRHPNIDVYFVTLNEEQTNNVIMNDDIIYIKGKESYMNILFKTFEAFDYINKNIGNKYDFIVRSNISTIIHLENLYKYLLASPTTNVYTGGTVETLQWLLQTYEISEKKQENRNNYYGLKYIQGTSIIMSNDVIQYILTIKETIEYDIVDDVKLGIIIREYFPEIYKNIENTNIAKVSHNKFEEDCVFIINKSNKRKLDIHRMRNIINIHMNSSICIHPNFDKIIHITYKIIDENLLKIKKEWEYLNPEYKVELYDNEMCLEILDKYYGKKYCDIFNFIKDGPIKADFFRICVLYIFGGIYVDSDIKPLIPFKKYVEDDLDFMTCISYNYNLNNNINFCYNPHLIVAKKYSDELLTIIYEYERLYNIKQPYVYWSWSICYLFIKFENFNITANGDNIFIYKNKKYKFIIEEILDQNTNETFNFENFSKIKNTTHNLRIYCKYMDNIVLYNFDNKF
jgi:mannosyltransferase OCH1-like enzyme